MCKSTHDDFYHYDKIPLGAKLAQKVTITCPEHGDFEQA